MTKETLLKFKEYYEKTGDKKNLDKLMKNLRKYELNEVEKDLKKK